jgi:hypothetical protein
MSETGSVVEDVAGQAPSAALLATLEHLPADHLDDGQALSMVVAAERLLGLVHALQAKALARFAQLRPADFDNSQDGCAYGRDLQRYAPDEIACALGISRHYAGSRLALAESLLERLPQTLGALEGGRIDLLKARVIAHATSLLPPEQATKVETQVLPQAGRLPHGRVRAAAERAAAALNPKTTAEGAQAAIEQRHVQLIPIGDGVSQLSAQLPAPIAAAAYDRISQLAQQARTPQDPRTADQRRADVLGICCSVPPLVAGWSRTSSCTPKKPACCAWTTTPAN